MAGDVVYADLTLPGGGFAPAGRQRGKGWFLGLFWGVCVPPPSAAPGGGEVCPVSRVGEDEPHPLLRRFSRIPSPLPGCPGCQLCPDAWLLRRCRCYWFSKKLGTWTEGKEHCEGEGSQLLVLQDGKELVKRGANGGSKPVWIGLRASEKQWKWVDNSTPSAEVLRSLRASENGCGTMKQGVLENDICDGEHRWVCQKKPFQLATATPENREKCNATG
uniref:C-type lectin domain-containing protein n=1 Tax=Apteryx owenii TaxID=8824 RepID=A0A8B9QQH3_APTOW